MKLLIFAVSIVVMQGCSGGSETSSLSESECSSVGGKLIDGQCQQPVSPVQMKSICDSQGMTYVEKFNGCIEK